MRRPNPRRSLTHPLWLGALALLLLNDHLLKSAELLPGWLTGKLSDFAGLLVAPLVLAVLVGVRSRRGLAVAHLAVGVGFAAINVSAAAAGAVELVTGATPLPWLIFVDPTDLIALPMLLVSYRVLGAAMWRAEAQLRSKAAQGAALAVGALACMATSPPCDGPNCGGPMQPQFPEESASLTIGNATNQQRLVRVRQLRDSVVADCEVLLEDPTAVLSRELFAPAETWLLEPGRALPLQNNNCTVYLVDAQGLGMTLLAWDARDYPTEQLPTSTEQPSDRMLMMRDVSGRLELDEHPAVFDAPPREEPLPEPACAVPDDTVGIDWSTVPLGTHTIASIQSSPDGCHLIETDSGTFAACLPLETLPFAVDEEVSFANWLAVGNHPELEGEQLQADGFEMVGATTALRAARGNVIVRRSDSGLFDAERDFSVSVETAPGCHPHHDECGNYVTPLEVSMFGADVPGVAIAGAGQAVAVGDDGATIHIVRAQHMPVRDTACGLQTAGETYFESVLVWTPQAQGE